jgi:hypothetical protein
MTPHSSSSRRATGAEPRPLVRQRRRERGLALVTVLYLVVVVGILASGALYAERRWAQSKNLAAGDARIAAVADDVLFGALELWNAAERAHQPVGSTHGWAVIPSDSADLRARLSVSRLGPTQYWLTADVTPIRERGGRRVSLLVLLPEPPLPSSPIVAAGDVVIGANVVFERDTAQGCSPDSSQAAITIAPDRQVLFDGLSPDSLRPTVQHSVIATDSLTYAHPGGMRWDSLAASATIRLTPGSAISPVPRELEGRCLESTDNWGEPSRDTTSLCTNRTPIVYASGDLTVFGGRGQGVLIVDGRLRMAGPLRFSGLIVARGGIEAESDGVEISGVVLSAATATSHGPRGPPGASIALPFAATLRLSLCDARYGMASRMRARPVRLRAWAEVF